MLHLPTVYVELTFALICVNLMDASRDQIFEERDRRSNLCYKKIVKLLGWAQIHLQHPVLVFEHSNDGDLWHYLHRYSGDELTIGVMKLLAYDIARGMEYLHYKRIVHGDLAARNCIVYRPRRDDDAWEVKVGDNGYYDANFEACYYNKTQDSLRCPVRWIPPENMPFRFRNDKMIPSGHAKSRKGDVWAFGVVLFEIWTDGEFPFAGMTDREVCRRVLKGYKATDYTHVILREQMDTVWNIMRSCWQPDPKSRPSFASILRIFEEREGCESSSEMEQSDYSDD